MWLSRARVLPGAVLLLALFAVAPAATWASGDASLAVYLERTAAAPLYGAFATIAAYLPFGEPSFRVALANAVLVTVCVLGVARAGRALFPGDELAGVVAGLLVVLTPSVREAAGPAVMAAAGAAWTAALLLEHAREATARHAIGAFAAATVVVGSAPWLGVALLVATAALTHRALSSRALATALAAIGAIVVLLWSTAIGRLPAIAPSLSSIVDAGRGAGAVALGAGLLGTAFGAATRLPHGKRLALAGAVAAIGAIVVGDGPSATAALAIVAVGAAAIPVAISRAAGVAQRHLVVAGAGIPLVIAALVSGPTLVPPSPGDAPARLATDLIGRLPPGPGVVLPTRTTTWTAVQYAQTIAGARPDLALAPFPPNDLIAADALRNDRIVGSDVPAFGRVDPTRAFPRGRGFQFLAKPPDLVAPVPSPARYASTEGEVEATLLALARARYEAGNGRLDAAARAAGLVGGASARFAAADLALLATTAPSRTRPAMFAFVPPLDHARPGAWMLDLFGDDLAWVAGIDVPLVERPRERKLHALWRQIWLGKLSPDDPQIAALAPAAANATREMLETLRGSPPAPSTPVTPATLDGD